MDFLLANNYISVDLFFIVSHRKALFSVKIVEVDHRSLLEERAKLEACGSPEAILS